MKSGRLYSLVTKYWPRIAAGLVVVIGLAELVVGGLTADSGLEFYLMAWAGVTGGLWFLFDKAESSLSEELRHRVVEWLRSEEIQTRAWTIPDQFAALFDLVFTSRPWSRERFYRSCLASSASVIIVFTLRLAFGAWSEDPSSARLGALIVAWAVLLWLILVVSTVVVRSRWWRLGLGVVFMVLFVGLPTVAHLPGPLEALDVPSLSLAGTVFAVAVLLNFIPDFASLLETRWAISWMGRTGRLWRLMAVDGLATSLISLLFVGAFYAAVVAPQMGRPFAIGDLVSSVLWPPSLPLSAVASDSEIIGGLAVDVQAAVRVREEFSLVLLSISFYSAFFTSAWLWLYALGTILARLLVRMNAGIGFLLRVTDLEHHPFRSMGFVSVLIVSGLFLLGLPFVLL